MIYWLTAYVAPLDEKVEVPGGGSTGPRPISTAAIAGGLAGLRWGTDGIPAEWLGALRGRPLVDLLLPTT